MSLLGIRVRLLVGQGVPLPLGPDQMDAIEQIEVKHADGEKQRSGFKVVFRSGRSGPLDLVDTPFMSDPRFGVLNRVILTVSFGLLEQVLFDGVIVEQQLQPAVGKGPSLFTVLGEDVSVMMDFSEAPSGYPAQPTIAVVPQIIARYSATYGLIPMVIPPLVTSIRLPIEGTNVQIASDLDYLRELAKACGYVFYIDPGPLPGTNTAYFGPKKRIPFQQAALTVNMGAMSNVNDITFGTSAEKAKDVSGQVVDRLTGQKVPVQSVPTPQPPLAAQPAEFMQAQKLKKRLRATEGMSAVDAIALASAQALEDGESVTVDGELDSMSYGGFLKARTTVPVRGVGRSYDGDYYVQSVTHTIKHGTYTQKFSLRREGLGTLTPIVRTA